MNNSNETHGLKELQNKKKSNNSLLIRSLHSKKSNLQNENEENSIQKNHINSNTHAIQTLSDAALNVKNLLSDFLLNADEDDKKIYHIEDELKRIKKNSENDVLNLFNKINDDDNQKENEEFLSFSNLNNSHNLNISHLKNNFDIDKKVIKRGKRFSLLINPSNNIENEENTIKNNKTFKYGLSSFARKLSKNLNDNDTIKTSFTMKKIKNKNNKKLYHKNIIHSPDHSSIKKKLSKFSIDDINLNNIEDEKKKRIKIINEKNKKIISGLKNKIGFEDIEKKKNFLKSHSINISKKVNNLNLNKKENPEFKTCKSLNESIDIIPDNNIDDEINNSNLYTRNFKTTQNFIKNKLTKKEILLQKLSHSYKFGKNKDKIRKYFNLEKKELSNLCENLRSSISFKSKNKRNNITENENNITNNTDNFLDKKKSLKKNHDQILRILTINKDEEIIQPQSKINKNKDDETLLLKNNVEESKFESDDDDTDRLLKEYQFRRLTRPNGLVYDSISGEESLEEIEGELYFDPNGNFIYYYDLILFILSIYAVIVPPLEIAFNHEKIIHFSSFSLLINFVIDIFFIIDFFLGFFTAYLDFEETLISNNKSILMHYLFGWFFVDLLSGIPVNSIFIIIEYKKTNTLILTYIDYPWKVYQLFRFVRLLKILKTCSNNSFTNSLINFIYEYEILEKWFTLLLYICSFFVSMHLLSCIFIFLSQLEHPNWVYTYNFEFNHDNIDIYLASFYYICATVFTTGYGDIISVSSYEKFFNLILLVFGMVIYSYIISALSNYVQSVDSKTLEYKKKLAILEQIRITYDKMPQILYDKISKFLLYRLHNEKRDKNDIMENIPLVVKNQLIMEMYKDIINNFIFFKNFENSDFIIKVILALKPIQASRNERLVNEGDYIEEIIFVKKGILSLEIPLPIIINEPENDKIEEKIINKQNTNSGPLRFSKILDPNSTFNKNKLVNESDTKIIQELNKENQKTYEQQYVKIIEIRRNEHFGDILMFLNKRSPISVKVKTKISELFLLQKTDAVEISMSFPSIWRKIIKKSLFNMEQIERLINKTLKFFFLHYHGGKKRGSFILRDLKNNKYRKSQTLLNSLSNDELYRLKTIPTMLSQYEEDEEEEEEEEEEEGEEEENKSESEIKNDNENKNESNNGTKNENDDENEGDKNKFQKKKKFDTNIKTIIKEVDEISDNSDMESSNNNKKKKKFKKY